MAKLNDCFFYIWLWYSWTVEVKFWVLIFKSMPKQYLKILDLKVAPVPPISCKISTFKLSRSSKFPPLHKLLHLPKIGFPLGPPFPRWTKSLAASGIEVVTPTCAFRIKSCGLVICMGSQGGGGGNFGGGWGRMELTKRGARLKEKGNLARRWWKDVKSRSFFFKIWLWS